VLLVLPICFLAFTSLYIGLNAEMIIQVADRIANEMVDTSFYIEAVLGK
jgi:multicomponent Na+:H+ antiporter subunit D